MSEPVPGIFKKMAKVMEKISRVPKNGKNKFFNYDYVTEADLTDHIRPILAEEGVAFTSTVLETSKVPTEKDGMLSTVKMLFRLMFQFLIGSLEAPCEHSILPLLQFQFLIGSLEASCGMRGRIEELFQFLIGSLEASCGPTLQKCKRVSIPHR